MMRILRFVAIAFILFIGLTEVIPWIRNRVEGISQQKIVGRPDPLLDGEASTCVHLAVQASLRVGDEIHGAKPPPGDSSGWTAVSDEISNQINEAEDACTCSEAGCSSARQAMGELSSLVSDINLMIGGQAAGAVSLANRQERIDVLLNRARVEAR